MQICDPFEPKQIACKTCHNTFETTDTRMQYCNKRCRNFYNNRKRDQRETQKNLEVVEVINDLVDENTQLEEQIELTQTQLSNIKILNGLYKPLPGEEVCRIHIQTLLNQGFQFDQYDLKTAFNKDADYLVFEQYHLYLTDHQFLILKRNK